MNEAFFTELAAWLTKAGLAGAGADASCAALRSGSTPSFGSVICAGSRASPTAPEQVIPLLNDYADAIVSAIHAHGGDVLKLIGDGTLAIFTAEDRIRACTAVLSAAIAARQSVAELNERRLAEGKPVTDMYLGLHIGEVFYGNVGSREQLDFTAIGPAVNEASRIAAICRSVDQPVLMSAAFADVGDIKRRLVSVGRYALRGVSRPRSCLRSILRRKGRSDANIRSDHPRRFNRLFRRRVSLPLNSGYK